MNASSYAAPRPWYRALCAVLSLLVLLTVSPAFAAGRVVWKETTIKERTKNEAWHLEMEIHLAKAPDIAHKGMKFEFTQTAAFERELVDGKEGPQTRTVPLTNQQSLIESVTVGFMDPGSGVTMNRTRFSFKVTRAHGYNAGTWSVKIRDTDTGAQIGHVQTLTFQGENEIVDRRSIVFHGKEKDKNEEKKEEAPPSEETSSEPAPEDQYMGEPEDPGQTPPSIEEKPGGGCHYVPRSDQPLWFLAGLALGLTLLVRRRS